MKLLEMFDAFLTWINQFGFEQKVLTFIHRTRMRCRFYCSGRAGRRTAALASVLVVLGGSGGYWQWSVYQHAQRVATERRYTELLSRLKAATQDLPKLTEAQRDASREGAESWLDHLLTECDEFLATQKARDPYAHLMSFQLAKAHLLLEQYCSSTPVIGLPYEAPLRPTKERSHQLLNQACGYFQKVVHSVPKSEKTLGQLAALRSVMLMSESRHILAVKKHLVGEFGRPDRQLKEFYGQINAPALKSVKALQWGDVQFYRMNDRLEALQCYRTALEGTIPEMVREDALLKLKCLQSYRTCNEDIYAWEF